MTAEELEAWICNNADALIGASTHLYESSCSDDYPSNSDRGCVRCALVRGKVSGCFPYKLEMFIRPVP